MILRCQPGGLHLPVWGGHSCPPLLTLGFLCRRASCLWSQIGFTSPNFESRSQSRRTKSVRPTQACSSHIGDVCSTSMFIRHRQDSRDSDAMVGWKPKSNPTDKECPSHTSLDRMYEYQRKLPHYQKEGRALFVTFRKGNRTPFPPKGRDAVMRHCLLDHGKRFQLHAAVVMPDHVHLLLTPLRDQRAGLTHSRPF